MYALWAGCANNMFYIQCIHVMDLQVYFDDRGFKQSEVCVLSSEMLRCQPAARVFKSSTINVNWEWSRMYNLKHFHS